MFSDESDRKITVSKKQVLEILRDNREKHNRTYEESLIAWREKLAARLKKVLTRLEKTGEANLIFTDLLKPKNHLKDYDVAIGMLEMDIQEEVVLSTHDYKTFVLDEWGWQRDFQTTTMKYTENG